ncbi:MAG: flagellar assembly protein FliH [Gammaproteobacteria bacterium]|jgi:flagellar assembly protein FliH|nr:flagellar assembly protein FliH [Gammaproteobacteria bacterium]MBU1846321.1 flagellar assembly protein FliH [Gammaproteobacteria bacterium]
MSDDAVQAFTRWKLPVFDDNGDANDDAAPVPDADASGTATAEPGSEAEVEAEPAFKLPTADELEKLQQGAHREGYAAGYEEGTARVRMEAMRLHSVVEQLEDALALLDTRVAQDVLNLGVEIARQVVRQTVTVKPDIVINVVKEAINQLPHQHTAVYLNPEDASLVRAHAAGEQLTHGGHRIFEDETIARGGCKVEAGGCQIDATLPTRWSRIVEALIDEVEWIQHD